MDSNTYTTGEMIDLISKDKELSFEAVNGMYDGCIVEFHNAMQWLMWNYGNNDYELIRIDNDFIDTKWKILSEVCVLQVNIPLMNVGKIYCVD
jgi:hypothetical protein